MSGSLVASPTGDIRIVGVLITLILGQTAPATPTRAGQQHKNREQPTGKLYPEFHG